MASSSGSLDTSANSPFSFMSTSFSDLLTGDYPSSGDRVAERTGSGVPKFKTLPPLSLPLALPPVSPSSYFAIPPGLSPTELLDSPVLLSGSHILPSPTTGTLPNYAFNWNNKTNNDSQQIKQENNYNNNYSDFSFQPQTRPGFQSQFQDNQAWIFQDTMKPNEVSSTKNMPKPEYACFSPESSTILQTNSQKDYNNNSNDNNNYNHSFQSAREQKKSDDGYNWRKYGQKQVKGSENPRSYYKCTYPDCPTKKKVERSLDGQITEIVYKGSHNHLKPQSTRRSSSSASQALIPANNEFQEQSYLSHNSVQMDPSVGTPDNSSISIGDDEIDQSSRRTRSGGDEFDEDEPEAKKWKNGGENEEGISAPGSKTVREPRVVVQTTSDIDILDDGYRWRKYGQKVVKGNPNPRSYYKCTNPGCPVRKHVERASQDLRSVITTYEGKHNHDVPPPRGSGAHSMNRAPPAPVLNTNSSISIIRPSAMPINSWNNGMANPIRGSRLQTSEQQSPFTLEMLQSPRTVGFGNSMASNYFNQSQMIENGFSRAKEEPRDDMFLESLLC